jgi:aryl carrier-like protein
MEPWLARQVASVLGRDAGALPRDVPLESLGLDSVSAVELASRLDARLGRPLHASVLYTVPTIAALAAWLVEGGHTVDRTGAAEQLYPRLSEQLAKLERRKPARYRFDLDVDIPWDRVDEPGVYVPREMFAALGIDTRAIEAEPEAWALLQTAGAMTLCAAFEIVEVTIMMFIDTRRSTLGATRSLELFREEEVKHVALFRRYAEVLAARHPDLVAELDWDPSWGGGFWELFRTPELFPSEGVFHYLFWFFFTAFEEHAIYFADVLGRAADAQPAWRAAHLAHRQEELQHVATDHAYLGALDLPAAEHDAWSEVCVAWLCQHFETFFAFGSARRLVAARFPDLAPDLRTGGFVRSPFLGELLSAPAFRRTRMSCPYLRELGELDPEQLPSDVELARRLPAQWLREGAALVPDPVVGGAGRGA